MQNDWGLPPLGDISFVSKYRKNAWYNASSNNKYDNTLQKDISPTVLYKRLAGVNKNVYETAKKIQNELINKPLAEGEQFNLMGYSYGSVMQAYVALALADAGHIIDNLILVGSPIPVESALYKSLQNHKNIKNVIREECGAPILPNKFFKK
jgi:hypothetical protein